MPRKLEEIIAGVRTAADAFKPAGINIPTAELVALCDAAEKYQQTVAAFDRASEHHQAIERGVFDGEDDPYEDPFDMTDFYSPSGGRQE